MVFGSVRLLGSLSLALALAACEPAPPSPAADAPAPADATDTGAALTPAPRPAAPQAGGVEPAMQPDGVPYPVPDPLPPEAQPRHYDPARAATPAPGAEPVEFWLGGKGLEDGQLAFPRALVVARDGSVFVADKSGRIQRWDAQGRLIAAVRTPGIDQGRPTGLGFDAEGMLLVADTHYCRVLIYTPELELLRAFGAPGAAPGQFMLLTSVRAGADGRLYTTDYGDLVARVQVWTAEGRLERAFGTFGDQAGQLRRPMEVAVDDARDRVYVADAVNHRIAIFTRAGEWVGQLGERGREPGQLDFPYDVKLDEDGNVWVAEFGNQRVSVLAPDGRCLGTWGTPGRAIGSVNRCWGVALGPAERVWVLDSGGDRVYALRRGDVLREHP